MSVFWKGWALIALADVLAVAVILMRDGAPENAVWWAFLIIPIFLAVAGVVGVLLNLVVR